MKVLLTGAGGMVGGALHRGLRREHEVIAMRRSDVDLLDAPAVTKAVARFSPDVVVHAAGKVGGIEANRRANSSFLVDNTVMGFNVVQASQRAGVPRLLNLSSSCVYPKDRELLHEDDLLTGSLEPTNQGYALAKISVMYLCQSLSAENSDLDYKTFVPCNLYGPGDHYEEDRSHLVPSAIRKVAAAMSAGERQVSIWGDGTARREFMYVDDLTSAVVLALQAWEATPDVLNIGVGQDHSVTEYYEAVARVIGYDGRFVHQRDKPVGMQRKLLDVTRASAWGWTSTTPLDEGLRAAVEDFRAHR